MFLSLLSSINLLWWLWKNLLEFDLLKPLDTLSECPTVLEMSWSQGNVLKSCVGQWNGLEIKICPGNALELFFIVVSDFLFFSYWNFWLIVLLLQELELSVHACTRVSTGISVFQEIICLNFESIGVLFSNRKWVHPRQHLIPNVQ